MASNGRDRSLVVIQLSGGNDALNTVVPYNDGLYYDNRPGVALDEQKEGDLIWIREEFLDADAGFDKMVVHGHSIQSEPDIQAYRIGIDTGAYRSCRLTCLVLEGHSRRFLHT